MSPLPTLKLQAQSHTEIYSRGRGMPSMVKYIINRLLLMIPILLCVSLLIFAIIELSPADPTYLIANDNLTEEQIEEIRDQYGFNDPFFVRYGRYMYNLLRGDLGSSYLSKQAVWDEFSMRFPYTLKLSGLSLLISTIVAIPLGILAARKQNTWLDSGTTAFSLLGISMPSFWLGLLLILLFSLKLRWLPSFGAEHPSSIILPAIVLSVQYVALMMRTTRSSMLDVLRQDYLRTERAKGETEHKVVWKYALKNALIPMLTVIGSSFGQMLGGAIVTENVFSWPGVGVYIIDAAKRADPAPVVSSVIIITAMVIMIQLIVDIMYVFVDPRIGTKFRR